MYRWPHIAKFLGQLLGLMFIWGITGCSSANTQKSSSSLSSTKSSAKDDASSAGDSPAEDSSVEDSPVGDSSDKDSIPETKPDDESEPSPSANESADDSASATTETGSTPGEEESSSDASSEDVTADEASDESGASSDESSGDNDSSETGDGEESSEESETTGEDEPTMEDVQKIFDRSCSCHNQQVNTPGDLLLLEGEAYEAMVGVKSSSELNQVEPGMPDESYLVHKLAGTHTTVSGGNGKRMPIDGMGVPDPLGEEEQQLIVDWIRRGAPKD